MKLTSQYPWILYGNGRGHVHCHTQTACAMRALRTSQSFSGTSTYSSAMSTSNNLGFYSPPIRDVRVETSRCGTIFCSVCDPVITASYDRK